MADASPIEWTDATWNPVRGCTRLSEGCRFCYAEGVAARFSNPGQAFHGFAERNRPGSKWTGKLALVPELLDLPLRWRRPRRVFVNSMSDLFHENLPDEAIEAVFGVMSGAQQHTFQILTKRPARMRDWMRRTSVLPNVWLGVSVENQAAADERIPLLLSTPAALRFLSCEPLLGPVDLDRIQESGTTEGGAHWQSWESCLTGRRFDIWSDATTDGWPRVNWVIAGGESGRGARPAHPDWFRGLRDQCVAAGTPFFFKQWGAWQTFYDRDSDDPDWRRCPRVKSPGQRYLNLAGGHGFHGDRVVAVRRVRKNVAGAVLDGREHQEFPVGQAA